MARTRKLTVEIAGDATGMRRAFGQAERSADGFGKKLASFGKVAALGLAGAGVGAVALGKSFVDAATESQKVTKQTEAVIKSMGGASKVTAKQVADLSTELSLKTGIDDELIQSGSNILLTFGKIRNEVGKGNKIFDRANAAALDMSVALGTDMTSAAMQVGKALNDPVAGLSKLRRSGIQFTKQQEDQVKAMVAVGDVAGAQKVMLEELERQFGGSAEAQATAADKLKVAWGNVQEQLGTALLPVVEKVATWLASNLPAAMAAASEAFDKIKPHIMDVVDAVKTFVSDALVVMKAWWDDNGDTVLSVINSFKEGVQMAFGAVIEAGKFVIDHWDQFQIVAGVMAAVIISHYVRIAAAAVASKIKQVAAWVATELAAIKAAVVHVVQVGIIIAGWALMAARAVIHAAVVVASWVATSVAARGATTAHGVAVAAQILGWGTLARAAIGHAASVALAWTKALGPIAAVVAAAEAANNLIGNKKGDPAAGNSLWDNLTRNPFDGMDWGFSIPGFALGGVVPGIRGAPQLIMAHGGETVVPTHQPGFASTLQQSPQPVIHTHIYLNNREIAEAVSDYNAVQSRNRAS